MPRARSIPLYAPLLAAALAAAQPGDPAPRGSQDPAARLTRYYESIAARTLARYYEEATFLVKAKVELEPPPEIELGGGENMEAPPQLPGLPFLPEDARPERPPQPKDDQPGGGVQAITLDILVDTGYSDKDVEFIRTLLSMSARLDEGRGDRVSVHEGVFPRDNRSLINYRKPVEPPPPPPPPKPAGRAPSDSGENRKADARDKAPANPFSQYLDHLPSLIPLLLICLLILACVWLVSRAIVGAARAGRKADTLLPPAPSPAPVPAAPAARPAADAKAQNPELAAFRPFLLNCFVGSPKHCGQILKSWIQRDPDRGMRDAAALIGSLDARLMGVLGAELGKDLASRLEVHLSAGDPPSAEDLLNVCKEFKREYGNLAGGNAEGDQYKDLFGFLRQMNEQQIMHILRDESMGIAGLVLAQLPGDTAGAILQKTDPDNRAKLLIAMGNIGNIPLNVYREIADRLSLKALEVGNMRYVAADGVDSIIELIDSLPLGLQFQYIHSISEMDLGLGEKLRNRYVTLPELVGLPDRFLAHVLQGLDQETLILALARVDDAVRNKVYALLPERMRMLIASGLEGAAERPLQDSEAAQRRLLRRIREEIRHSGRPV